MAEDGPSSSDHGAGVDSIILEEEIDPNYVPTEAEIIEYAKWLGMDLKKDQDLFWVAKEGLMAPLPKNWKPCKTKDTDDIYYFNFASGESTWDHPCDGYYKRLYEEEKKRKEMTMKENNDQKRTRAKQDVEQLLGKNEKKKKKKDVDALSANLSNKMNASDHPNASSSSSSGSNSGMTSLAPLSSSLSSLERKPLPGILPKATTLTLEPTPIQIPRVSVVSSSAIDANNNRSSFASADAAFNASPQREQQQQPKQNPLESRRDLDAKLVLAAAEEKATAADTDRVSPSASSASTSLSSFGHHDSPPSYSNALAEAKPSTSHEADTRRAPTTTYSSSHVDESKLHTGGGANEELVADLRFKLRRLEADLDHKSRSCDRLEGDVAEVERRLAREKQAHTASAEAADNNEKNLLRQLDSAKERNTRIERINEQLEKEAQELRMSSQKLQLELKETKLLLQSGAGGGSISTVESCNADSNNEQPKKEGYNVLESAQKRNLEAQEALRQEMLAQETLYQAKLRLSAQSLMDSREDLARVQQQLEDLRREGDVASKKSASQRAEHEQELDLLREEVANLKRTAIKSGISESSPLLEELKAQVQQLNLDLSVSKSESDELRNKNRRLEQLASSWEGDCADKEIRLQQTRTRATEWQDNFYRLESEMVSLRASVRSDNNDTENAEKLVALQSKNLLVERELEETKVRCLNLQSLVGENESLKAALTNKDSQLLALQEETAKLRRQFEERELHLQADSDSVDAIAKRLQADEALAKLNSETESLRLKVVVLSERNVVLQAETDKLREALSSVTDHRSSSILRAEESSNNRIALIEGELTETRRDLLTKLEASKTLSTQYELLRAKHEWAEAEYEAQKERTKQSEELCNGLRAELRTKGLQCAELEAVIIKLQGEISVLQSTIELKSEEVSRLRQNQETVLSRMSQGGTLAEVLQNHEPQPEAQLLQRASMSSASTSRSPPPPPPPHPNTESRSNMGIVELSIVVGQQQELVKQLEEKLKALSKPNAGEKGDADAGIDEAQHQSFDKSLLREMLQEFAQRRKPFTAAAASGKDDMQVIANIAKEKKFILNARAALKEEKAAIRWEQERLMKRREAWKKQRKTGGSQSTKELTQALNQQTSHLNLAVEQARKTQEWLNERERKLDRLQDMVSRPSSLRERKDEHENFKNFLHFDTLGRELDADAEMISMHTFLTPGSPEFDEVENFCMPNFPPPSYSNPLTNNAYAIAQKERLLQERFSQPQHHSAMAFATSNFLERQRSAAAIMSTKEMKREGQEGTQKLDDLSQFLSGLRSSLATFAINANSDKNAQVTQSSNLFI